MMLTVPGTKVCWKQGEKGEGPLVSWDGGREWHFTFRGEAEFRQMYPNAVGETTEDTNEDTERELFGETLDDPIPDDLWEMIAGTP